MKGVGNVSASLIFISLLVLFSSLAIVIAIFGESFFEKFD